MEYNDRKKIIFEKLANEIRVAVQYDGFVNDNFKEVFDSYANTNNLTNFKDVKDECKNIDHENRTLYEPFLAQVDKIEKALNDRSDVLTRNSIATNVNLERVPLDRFVRLAKRFESENKEILVVTSPNQFL